MFVNFVLTPVSVNLPEQPKTDKAKVPASILSGITSNSPPFNFFTPSIVITSVPWPLIFAPICIKNYKDH